MLISRSFRRPGVRAVPALLSLVALLVAIAACGGGGSTDAATIVLLDQTLLFEAGQGCDVGGLDADFAGTAGRTVTIEATGASSLTPRFTLYAPDFSTQLASSSANGSGKAKLVLALAASGTHHITLCEATGKAGSVRVRVTAPVLGG